MKIELPSFNVNVSIEEYLDWVNEVEKFFDYMDTPDDKQVCLLAYKLMGRAFAYKLMGRASTQWDRVQLNRTHERKLQIRSWKRMKRLMA